MLESVAFIADDTNNDAPALIYAQEAVDLSRQIKTSTTTLAPRPYAGMIYIDVLVTLASCQATAGDYATAYLLLDEAKRIYQKIIAQAPRVFFILRGCAGFVCSHPVCARAQRGGIAR